jgi:allophanate hydrolase
MREAQLAARKQIESTFDRTVRAPFGPFLAAGELLYQGPWVAERLAEFGGFLTEHPDSVLPVIRAILESGSKYSAVDVFAAEHRLGELRAEVAQLWHRMDVLVLPAIGTTFTVDQVLDDPIGANTKLGHYTHFGNLLDLCAVVVPAGLTSDGRPAALMILGPALADDRVLGVAAELTGVQRPSDSPALSAGASVPAAEAPNSVPSTTTLVVAGHHMTGQPREFDLLSRGGSLISSTLTAPVYRLMKIGESRPVPALVSVENGGAAIEVETWSLPSAVLGEILATASRALCFGHVQLADGTAEIGFVADVSALADPDIRDITEYGGWRGYLAAQEALLLTN